MKTGPNKRGKKPQSGAKDDLSGSFPASESIAYLLRDTYKAFAQALKQELDHYDVNFGSWNFLRILWEEDGLTQGELTRRVGMMQPNTNAALKQLARRGLIRQSIDASDRRRINIFLTPQGRVLRKSLIPAAKKIREQSLDGFTKREVSSIRVMLAKMKRNLAPSDIKRRAVSSQKVKNGRSL